MSFKKIAAVTVFSLSAAFSMPSHAAGVCGAGKVVRVTEGGFNSDDLYVRVEKGADGVDADGNVIDTLYRFYWVRYRAASHSTERLSAIRSIAYLAFASGKSVYTYTHTDSCADATEIALYEEGQNPLFNGYNNNPASQN